MIPSLESTIYQIYYNDEQIPLLDPNFIAYDNSKAVDPKQFEYDAFINLYENKCHEKKTYVGAVSWKFNEKTGINGDKFLKFIQKNPGYDVYFINPFPRLIKYTNPWLQGELFHANLIHITQAIFDQLNYSIDLRKTQNDIFTTAYCNYWVGNHYFWEKYMNFTRPIYDYIFQNAPLVLRELCLEKAADCINGFSYYPFIFERLFSLLLIIDPSIKHKVYQFSYKELRSRYSIKEATQIQLAYARKPIKQNNKTQEYFYAE